MIKLLTKTIGIRSAAMEKLIILLLFFQRIDKIINVMKSIKAINGIAEKSDCILTCCGK